jgi:hypothetical protein
MKDIATVGIGEYKEFARSIDGKLYAPWETVSKQDERIKELQTELTASRALCVKYAEEIKELEVNRDTFRKLQLEAEKIGEERLFRIKELEARLAEVEKDEWYQRDLRVKLEAKLKEPDNKLKTAIDTFCNKKGW